MDEPDAALDEAPREETHPAVRLRRLFRHAVEAQRLVGLAREIDRLGRFRLHAEGELVAFDPRLELGVLRPRRGVAAVELLEQRELFLLPLLAETWRRLEIRDRLGARLEANALIDRRHESRPPVARPIHDRGGIDR